MRCQEEEEEEEGDHVPGLGTRAGSTLRPANYVLIACVSVGMNLRENG